MLNEDSGTLRTVAWSEVCPWLNLFRCFRLAIRFRLLLLSAVAILLTVTTWAVFAWAFLGPVGVVSQTGPYGSYPWLALTDLVPDKPGLPGGAEAFVPGQPGPPAGEGFEPEEVGLGDQIASTERAPMFERSPEPFWGSFEQLSRPFRQIFSPDVDLTRLGFLLACGLATLLIWAFFGSCITRVAAVHLASEERLGWGAMLRHACSKWRAYLAAPLFPLVGVLFGAVLLGALGLLLQGNVGLLIAALIWPLFLVGGVLAALMLLGLLFGWPLMWATISAEGTDSFDALARAYSYVFQRPLRYLFYAVVAILFGILGWLLVSNFAAAVISLTYWAADWGAGQSVALVGGEFELRPGGGDPQHVGLFGAGLIRFWCGCVKLLAVGFLYSYFWTASTAIYFLLRRDADATEMDEVFLEEEEEEEETAGLPPLKTDEAGAPAVADDETPGEDADLPSRETDVPSRDTDDSGEDADPPSEE